MPSVPATTDDAYALEASTWFALQGHIPGDPLHDAVAWRAWRVALHAALDASAAKAAGARASTTRAKPVARKTS